MEIYNIVIIDEEGDVEIYNCNTIETASFHIELLYNNIKSAEELEGHNITYSRLVNQKRRKEFTIRWDNIEKDENGNEQYPDTYKEYECRGYMTRQSLLTEIDCKPYK